MTAWLIIKFGSDRLNERGVTFLKSPATYGPVLTKNFPLP